MSLAIPSKEYVGLPIRASDNGVSSDSKKLRELLSMIAAHFRQSAAGQRLENALESLIEVYQACLEPNWDGYGARPISEAAYFEAVKILGLLPPSLPMPEIVPEPNGEIAFEWYKGREYTFVISVGGNNIITYAGLFGKGNETHGTEYFIELLPTIIVDNIRRLFSKGQ
jgi:hypothetical protein